MCLVIILLKKKLTINYNINFSQDGSTMYLEAAKGGHTNVVSYLLDYQTMFCQFPPQMYLSLPHLLKINLQVI